MPLPLAFTSNPETGNKLYSITEDDEENHSDKDVLAILRRSRSNASRTSPTSSSAVPIENRMRTKHNRTKGDDDASSRSNITTTGPEVTSGITKDQTMVPLGRLLEAQKAQHAIILNIQRNQQSTEGIINGIVQQISLNKEELCGIIQGMHQIQSSISNINSHRGEDALSEIHNSLKKIEEAIESSRTEHREALLSLKSLAESERKSFQAQINSEKKIASNQRIAFEREIEMLRIEMQNFQAEKEELGIVRQKLERSEALLEQRKMAAREEIETAEEISTRNRKAEARIDDKTERLIQLSEYVKRKDEEAQEKLEQAEENKRDLEDADKQRLEISENRIRLARDRNALLKERQEQKKTLFHHGLTAQATDFGLLQSSLRRSLISIRDDMYKLRQDGP